MLRKCRISPPFSSPGGGGGTWHGKQGKKGNKAFVMTGLGGHMQNSCITLNALPCRFLLCSGGQLCLPDQGSQILHDVVRLRLRHWCRADHGNARRGERPGHDDPGQGYAGNRCGFCKCFCARVCQRGFSSQIPWRPHTALPVVHHIGNPGQSPKNPLTLLELSEPL